MSFGLPRVPERGHIGETGTAPDRADAPSIFIAVTSNRRDGQKTLLRACRRKHPQFIATGLLPVKHVTRTLDPGALGSANSFRFLVQTAMTMLSLENAAAELPVFACCVLVFGWVIRSCSLLFFCVLLVVCCGCFSVSTCVLVCVGFLGRCSSIFGPLGLSLAWLWVTVGALHTIVGVAVRLVGMFVL